MELSNLYLFYLLEIKYQCFYPSNLSDVSDEQWERFCQDIKIIQEQQANTLGILVK